jgi:hypothetical protein
MKTEKTIQNACRRDSTFKKMLKRGEERRKPSQRKVVTNEIGTVSYNIDKPKVVNSEDNADVWYKYEGKLNGEHSYRSSN